MAAVSGATSNDAASDAARGGVSGNSPIRVVGPPGSARVGRAHTVSVEWRAAAMALLTLAICSASVWLCIRAFALPAEVRDGYLTLNKLPPLIRKRFLIELAAAMLMPFAVALPLMAARGAAAIGPIRTAADRLCPFVLVFALPLLLNARLWSGSPLSFLTILLAVVFGLERLVTRALESPIRVRPAGEGWVARLLPFALVVAGAAAYAAYTSHFSILRHQRLASAGFDLGIFDNLMVNALEGRPFYSSLAVPKGSYLSNHAEFGMYLFAPVYALWPRAETLLILQSVFMGFAAVPLYFFAKTQLTRAASAALAIAYLLFAPLHGPNFFDFHWMPVSMLFFFWLFHAIATRRRWLIAMLSVVICSMREDAPFGLIATGLFLITTGYWPRLGALLTVLPSVWFVIVKFVIMPLAGPWWFSDIYRELFAPGETGYGSVVRTILVNPNYFLKTLLTEAKLTYVLHMLAPLVFLPLRYPALALLAIPGFVVTLMTTGYAPTLSIRFQYTTHWIPFLFGAAVLALALRRERNGVAAARASLVALCAGVVIHSYVFGAILQREDFTGGFSKVAFTMTPDERQRYRDLKELAAMIPPRASVAAGEREIAHVSNRPNAYTLKITAGRAEYILVHRYHLDANARRHIEEVLAVQPYDLVAQKGNFSLFKRGKTTRAGYRALRSLQVTVPYSKPSE